MGIDDNFRCIPCFPTHSFFQLALIPTSMDQVWIHRASREGPCGPEQPRGRKCNSKVGRKTCFLCSIFSCCTPIIPGAQTWSSDGSYRNWIYLKPCSDHSFKTDELCLKIGGGCWTSWSFSLFSLVLHPPPPPPLNDQELLSPTFWRADSRKSYTSASQTDQGDRQKVRRVNS